MAGRRGRRVYNDPRWQRIRRVALDRDGWRCTQCGRPGRLEVHHKRALADGGPAFDLANLATLCRPCHFAAAPAPQRPPEVAAWWRLIDGTV